MWMQTCVLKDGELFHDALEALKHRHAKIFFIVEYYKPIKAHIRARLHTLHNARKFCMVRSYTHT